MSDLLSVVETCVSGLSRACDRMTGARCYSMADECCQECSTLQTGIKGTTTPNMLLANLTNKYDAKNLENY